ncbi:uncharacterized protein LOC130612685 [Hydractinia symbiolongicarpus]|uniref:uncharacterized protein LOC130612685 n=1 Tax=Hydractinia symbiolongicarpus TaxID=13093 RepID=UPI00254F2A5C|nr:uncharacterized protein LOC130612685 [Hydractinia symbiolongicarpus]XP_057290021.1 uncharacterized protein LOC130612685 [Hydractinia symbiolongicarpus]
MKLYGIIFCIALLDSWQDLFAKSTKLNLSSSKKAKEIVKRNIISCHRQSRLARCDLGNFISERGCNQTNFCPTFMVPLDGRKDQDIMLEFFAITKNTIPTVKAIFTEEKYNGAKRQGLFKRLKRLLLCFKRLAVVLQSSVKFFQEKAEERTPMIFLQSKLDTTRDVFHKFPITDTCPTTAPLSNDLQMFAVLEEVEITLVRMHLRLMYSLL